MIINLYGGPGTGKSTVAAGLFHKMKTQGRSVELVTEYAKDLYWEDRTKTLQNQLYVDAKQYRNLARVASKVDYVITDSPLMKGPFYAQYYNAVPDVEQYIDMMKKFDLLLGPQLNYLLKRETEYEQLGRNESKLEAERLDTSLAIYLSKHVTPTYILKGGDILPETLER